jgi:putative membrane protein
MQLYLIHWIIVSTALMMTAYFVPGFRVNSIFAALFASLVIGFVNTIIWPILALLTLPLTLLTFGLFLLVVNGLALKIAAALSPGFAIEGMMPAVIGSIVLTVTSWFIRYIVFGADA